MRMSLSVLAGLAGMAIPARAIEDLPGDPSADEAGELMVVWAILALVIFALGLVIAYGLFAKGSGKEPDPDEKNIRQIVDRWSGSSGSSTWTHTFFSDGTGETRSVRYFGGRPDETKTRRFTWHEDECGNKNRSYID